jgi:hypothetical protein
MPLLVSRRESGEMKPISIAATAGELMEHSSVDHSDIQTARCQFVDKHEPERRADAAEKGQSKEWRSWWYSLRYRLISEVAHAAAQHTIETSGPCSDFWPYANHGMRVVDDLTLGLTKVGDDDHTDPKFWNFWQHQDTPLKLIVAKKTPYTERDFLSGAASEYLKLPYRAPLLERRSNLGLYDQTTLADDSGQCLDCATTGLPAVNLERPE